MEYSHKTVLLYETVDNLNIKDGNTYVDATFGGGGHSRYILSKSENINLYVFDQDEEAIKNGVKNFSQKDNIHFINTNFVNLKSALYERNITKIDGLQISISGRAPTIVVTHRDIPGTISNITRTTGQNGYNIFKINIGRDKRGGTAIMTLELDGNYVMPGLKDILLSVEHVLDVIILQPY